MRVAVLVPVKAFAQAKLRLAPSLDSVQRADLARRMAATVLAAAGDLPVAVVCDDDEVRTWSKAAGADVVWTPGLGLNGAVEAGVAWLGQRGIERAIVAHADLPLATDLAWVGDFEGVTLVPDRHFDGTNVACVPTSSGFRFAYGPGSFAAHRTEATRLGVITRLVPDPRLGWDVDLPADLDVFLRSPATQAAAHAPPPGGSVAGPSREPPDAASLRSTDTQAASIPCL